MGADSAETRTTCPYCGVGCGVIARRDAQGTVTVAGDPGHPANFGRLCSKGSALAETIDLDGRLLHPEIAGRRVSWDEALGCIAGTFARTIEEHGPDSVAFYVSGQLLTEDYYVANKLMKGFVGAANIDTNSRLCMASAVAGHRRAFGADVVPGNYEDLEEADLVVLVGSNLAWCHPVLYQRLMAAGERRPELEIVVVDPRRTATAESADQHLAIAPDTDVTLFLGLLSYLERHRAADPVFIARHTRGLRAALDVSASFDVRVVAAETGVSIAALQTFYRRFARTERVVTVFSQGVNQSVSGTDKVNAIINCHLLTGRIGRPGMGPFSVTGQPNAMGGREVGGLANQLAAHLDIEDGGHRALVRAFWGAPRMAERPGLKAVDMFEAVHDGRIKALWIMATNPAATLPDSSRVRQALAKCSFVVVSDVVADTDTLRFAHVKLPAAAWAEKDGTVTNSERRISRQRAFLPLPGEARPDWWIVTEVARRMGFAESFAYRSAADIFREHAALTALANSGRRPLDLGGLACLDDAGYDALEPIQWPVPSGSARTGTARLFADGRFATANGRARFVPTPRPPAEIPMPERPLVLNTGRVRDHWHTMTRTGKSPRLSRHFAEPFVEVAPEDARARGIRPATLVRVRSQRGSMLVRALVTDRQRLGAVFAPMHWTGPFASIASVDLLVGPATDPVSGQPGLKHTSVQIEAAEAAWYGFAVTRSRLGNVPCDYWARARTRSGFRLELVGLTPLADPAAFAATLLRTDQNRLLSYRDTASARHRFAALGSERVEGLLFLSPEPVAVARDWIADEFDLGALGETSTARLLAGRPGADRPDDGAIVCACNAVGVRRIAAAITAGALTIEAVGGATAAGTSCGSCRAEIGRAIAHAAMRQSKDEPHRDHTVSALSETG